MKSHIALFVNPQKPAAIYWAEFAAQKLRSLEADIFAEPDVVAKFSDETRNYVEAIPLKQFEKFADVVLSFGGDGTMLAAARLLIDSEVPIMGVNVGKLGFLAEFSVHELETALDALHRGNYRVVDRTMIETELRGERLYALNEFVVEKVGSPKMIVVQASAGDYPIADYRADGIIITTPTGSTAYSLSCGGPVIAPSTNVLCLTPIAPHSLTMRPLVIADTLEVTLKLDIAAGSATLVADGQIERTMKNGEEIRIRRSEKDVKIIKHSETTYFELLRKKLLWSADPAQ